jgi:mannose/cellobiose epimerase-like protein (N-acyl-D-glucosamine 2-epimerase family)
LLLTISSAQYINGCSIIEPGHLYEWSWLLARWGSWSNSHKCIGLAQQLCFTAESYGIHPRLGHVIGSIDNRLCQCDLAMKLWQQTERLKSLWSLHLVTSNDYSISLSNAYLSISTFLNSTVKGLWIDEISPTTHRQSFVKASSGYHISRAIETLLSDEVI